MNRHNPILERPEAAPLTTQLGASCKSENASKLEIKRVLDSVSNPLNKPRPRLVLFGGFSSLPGLVTPSLNVAGRLLVDLSVILISVCLAASFIPTCEAIQSEVFHLLVPGFGFPVVKVALALIVHSVTWCLVSCLLHRALCINTSHRSTPWSHVLFAVCMGLMSKFFEFSLLALFWGAPMVKPILVGFGARVSGPLWCFGRRLCDAPHVTFNGPTIVDSSSVNGHAVVGGNVMLGKCEVSGVLHEGTICLANTSMVSRNGEGQAGPVQFVSQKPKSQEEVHPEDFDA